MSSQNVSHLRIDLWYGCLGFFQSSPKTKCLNPRHPVILPEVWCFRYGFWGPHTEPQQVFVCLGEIYSLANKTPFLGWWYCSTSLLGCFCEIMTIDGVFVCVCVLSLKWSSHFSTHGRKKSWLRVISPKTSPI